MFLHFEHIYDMINLICMIYNVFYLLKITLIKNKISLIELCKEYFDLCLKGFLNLSL